MAGLLTFAHSDIPAADGALRLAIACDADGGTLNVHFLRPLARARAERRCAIAVIAEPDIARMTPGRFAPAFAAWLDSFDPQALVLSRCGGVHTPSMVAAARARGVPIIGHLDDNLFDLPRDIGPAWARLMAPDRLARLRHGLDAAETIWLSTPELARQLGALGLAAPLAVAPVPAGADPAELRPPKRIRADGPLTIGYIAGSTHGADFALVAPALARLLRQRADARLVLWGTIDPPAELEAHAARVETIPYVHDYADYQRRLAALDWDIGLAPLRDTPHNRAKTNAKWVDCTIAGIPVIASDLAPYRAEGEKGASLLAADDGWDEALALLSNDSELRATIASRAQTTIANDYTLETMERALLDLFESKSSNSIIARTAWRGQIGSPDMEKKQGEANYIAMLETIHAALEPRRYLEIGVRKGRSLALARCESIGIDPAPDPSLSLPGNAQLFTGTSDQFFADPDVVARAGSPDLTFVDGMHLFEYVLRDFINIERVATRASVVVIDDALPSHEAQARRDRCTRSWTGDVWKIKFVLETYRPDLLVIPVDVWPTGMLIVARLDPASRVLSDRYDSILAAEIPERAPPPEILTRSCARHPADPFIVETMASLRRERVAESAS